jgi:hypothetical protein
LAPSAAGWLNPSSRLAPPSSATDCRSLTPEAEGHRLPATHCLLRAIA